MANKFRTPKTEELEELEELVEQEEPRVISKPSKPGKKGVLAKGLSKVFGGSFLSDERALKYVPYILFVSVIAIFYIAWNYYADDKIREVNRVSNEIKELRTEFITTVSDKMFISKQSQVAAAVDTLGLKEPVIAPLKIEMDSVKKTVSSKKQAESSN